MTSSLTGETMTSFVSISLSTIFISFLIIPWLAKYVHDEMQTIMRKEGDTSTEPVRPGSIGLEEFAAVSQTAAATSDMSSEAITAKAVTAIATTTVVSEKAVPEAANNSPSNAANNVKKACNGLHEGNRLTPREFEIAVLLYERYDNETIAERLFISPNTLKVHIRRIYQKFQVSRKKELILTVDQLCIDNPFAVNICEVSVKDE